MYRHKEKRASGTAVGAVESQVPGCLGPSALTRATHFSPAGALGKEIISLYGFRDSALGPRVGHPGP